MSGFQITGYSSDVKLSNSDLNSNQPLDNWNHPDIHCTYYQLQTILHFLRDSTVTRRKITNFSQHPIKSDLQSETNTSEKNCKIKSGDHSLFASALKNTWLKNAHKDL
jgi:hypothetical protein